MLLVSSRNGGGCGTNGALARVPRVSSGASGGTGCGWVGDVNNLFEICLGKIIRRGQISFWFGNDSILDGHGELGHRRGLFLYSLSGFGLVRMSNF